MGMQILGNKKIIRAWTFYDWANSAYPLVIETAIFPIFYSAITSNGADHNVDFFGVSMHNATARNFALGVSFILVSILSPFLSGIADYAGKKKLFLKAFCYLGGLSSMSLYFFNPNHLELSMLSLVGANLGFWGSIVFYNSYLPEIAEPKDHDKISARGFALGYLGSSILLIINLVLLSNPHWLFDIGARAQELMAADASLSLEVATQKATGYFKGQLSRWAFVSVGVWWIGFAQITLTKLPNNVFGKKITDNRYLYKGFQELKQVYLEVKENKAIKRYLLAFFVYSVGVQTVLTNAAFFGAQEVNIGQSELILTLMIIQFIAIIGALLFSKASSKFGNFKVLTVALIVWMIACMGAYIVTEAKEFYILAATVGLVMGGIQALSRSTYSKILPRTLDHASYFSFYDVVEKLANVLGLFGFGVIASIFGNMRSSIFFITTFFIIGIILLSRVPKNAIQKASA